MKITQNKSIFLRESDLTTFFKTPVTIGRFGIFLKPTNSLIRKDNCEVCNSEVIYLPDSNTILCNCGFTHSRVINNGDNWKHLE